MSEEPTEEIMATTEDAGSEEDQKKTPFKALLYLETLLPDDMGSAMLEYRVDMQDQAHIDLKVAHPEDVEQADAAGASTIAAYLAVRFCMSHLNEIALRLKRKADGLE